MSKKNTFYSLEVKLEVIRLREEGYSVKEIQKRLDIKSNSQFYTWWYWYRDGETHRLSQPIGKQYSFDHGTEGSTLEESLKIRNEILENQIKVLKKYKKMERKWSAKYS